MTAPQGHRPLGTREDPIYVRPAGATPAETSSALRVLVLVGWAAAVLTAFGVGSPVVGVVLLVLGGAVLALCAWCSSLDPAELAENHKPLSEKERATLAAYRRETCGEDR